MENSKKGFLFVILVLFASNGFGQQSEYYKRAAELFRQAEAKTKCPEKAQVLEEYAKWNDRMVHSLADPSFSAGAKPTTPIPSCDGDNIGGGGSHSDGNSSNSQAISTESGQVQTGIDNITALSNMANAIGPSAKFGIGADYAPIFSGNNGIYFSQGIGVSGKVEIPISKTVSIGIADLEEIIDVTSAAQKDHNLKPSYNFNVPKISLKYQIAKPLYFEVEGGYCVSSSPDFKNGLAFSIGLGIDAGAFELGGRYESWGSNSEITQLAVHLGVRF